MAKDDELLIPDVNAPAVKKDPIVDPDLNKKIQDFSAGKELNAAGEEIAAPTKERVDEFNKKFPTVPAPTPKVSDKFSADQLKKIAEDRLAAGEISQEEFDKAEGLVSKRETDKLKVEPIKDTPVLSAQEIKSNELANKVAEDAIKTEEGQKALVNFEAALESGNKDDLTDMVIANPDLKTSFNSLVRNKFKTDANIKYVGKYSSFTVDQLDAAVKSGDIVVGSEQYNLLPEPQRTAFNQFQNQDNAIATAEDNKNQFAIDNNKTISLDSIFSDLKNVFSSDLRTQYEEAMNSSEITETAKDLEDKQNQVNAINDSIQAIEDDVKSEHPNLTGSQQASIIADRQKSLLTKKNTLINEYNSKLGTYKSLKDTAQLELDFIKYEDQQNKALYTTALGLYETRRSEMRADEQAEFLLKNKAIATATALDNEKELAVFKQGLIQDNVKGKWEQRFDGLYFLTDTGEANKIIDGGLKVNTDGTSTYTYVDKDNNPIVENYDITGQLIGAGTANTSFSQPQVDLLNASNGTIIPSRLKTVTNPNGGKECAEYMNDIFSSSTGSRMGDTYSSKLAVANERTGSLGSMAVWQPNPSNKEFAKFGHAGVIVGESNDGDSWHIKSSNLNADGKISIVSVPKNVIEGYKSTNLFNKTEGKTFNDAQTNFLATVDTSKGFNKEAKATISNLGLTEEDVFSFKAKTLPKEKTQFANDILSKISNMKGDDGQFSSARGFSGAVGFGFGEALLPGTRSKDFATDFESFKSLLTVENLDKMSGVLTDKDIEILKSAALSIDLSNSEVQFVKRIKEVENVYKKALGLEVITPENLFFTDEDGVEYTQDSLKVELLRMIDDGEATAEQIIDWKNRKNITL